MFLIILNVVQLFATTIVVTVHALAIVVNVVSAVCAFLPVAAVKIIRTPDSIHSSAGSNMGCTRRQKCLHGDSATLHCAARSAPSRRVERAHAPPRAMWAA